MRSCHGYLGQLQWPRITPPTPGRLVFCSSASSKPSHLSGTCVTASSCHCPSDLSQDEPAHASAQFLILWRNRLAVLQLWASCWMQAVILSACRLPLGCCFRCCVTHYWIYFPKSLALYNHSPGYKWENRLGMLVLCTCNPSVSEITAKGSWVRIQPGL